MDNFLTNVGSQQFFTINLVNAQNLTELIIRFLFNLLVILVIVRFLYYSVAKRKDYFFTYVLISSTVFVLAYLLENVTLQLGFALGLFAIFGILRYRTTTIPIKEMTYLFVVIGISIINALSNSSISFLELLFTNVMMILITWGLESFWLAKHETTKTIVYDNPDLVGLSHHQELKNDLEKKLGFPITRFEIGQIDYVKRAVKIKVFFIPDRNSRQWLENGSDSSSNLN